MSPYRQCNEPSAIRQRNECNANLKTHIKQCLNQTEELAFNKIVDIALQIDKVMCGMNQEKMKSIYELLGGCCCDVTQSYFRKLQLPCDWR